MLVDQRLAAADLGESRWSRRLTFVFCISAGAPPCAAAPPADLSSGQSGGALAFGTLTWIVVFRPAASCRGPASAAAPRAGAPCAEKVDLALLAAVQGYLRALGRGEPPPAGGQGAWRCFYAEYHPLVREAVRACRVRDGEAEDCVQEAWAELAVRLPGFTYDPSRGSFRGWLRRVVGRTAVRWSRRWRRGGTGARARGPEGILCHRLPEAAAICEREELRALVREALAELRRRMSPATLEILFLGTVEGQSAVEIAARLGLSPGQVRTRHHRARRLLRRLLERRLEGW